MNEIVVIYVGLLSQYQGIDLLLEAIPPVVREVPEVKFLIVGYPGEQFYRDRARALGVERWTHFTGRIPYEEVPRYLSLADIAVSPKISATEANLKLFTYMAMGLPTVVFDNPINREILDDLGVYAKNGDVESLAAALIHVLQDRAWAQQLGKLSRQKAAALHSWLQVGKRLGDIYNSIAPYTGSGSKEQADGQRKGTGYWGSRFRRFPFSKRIS
jgi:glycosyltransferase involved in cell wall biosynthesis